MSAVAPTKLGYVPAIDGIRAIAVIAVVLFHLNVHHLVRAGYLGVDVFFSLSGFLITFTSVLIEEWRETGRISLRRFYLRRILRLVPALVVAALVSVSVSGVVDVPGAPRFEDNLRGAALGLTYVTAWFRAVGDYREGFMGHLWSLSVEEHFYLLWPMTVVAARKLSGTRPLIPIVGLCIVSIVYRQCILPLLGFELAWLTCGPDACAEQLLIGAAAAATVSLAPASIVATGLQNSTVASICGIAIACAFTLLGDISEVTPLLTATALCTASVAASVSRNGASRLARVLALKPIVWIGKRSYGLYVWHVPVFGLTEIAVVGKALVIVKAVARVALAIAAAALSYEVVEKRFLRLKSRFSGTQPQAST